MNMSNKKTEPLTSASEKKLCIKRIVIFVSLAYGIAWIPEIIRGLTNTFQDEAGFMLFTNFMMFAPAAASLLTRYITKEGMKNSLLRLNFKGNGIYYLLSILLPLIYSAIEAALYVTVLKSEPMTAEAMRELGVSPVGYTASVFMSIAFVLPLFPIFLGEELGWRGYLFPKLKEVVNRPAAYIICGIIWGVWHAPAIIDGLNFGKDYPGYPFMGILLMCLFCIGVGIIFTWLTEKTNSIYPAAFAHAVNNNVAGLIIALGGDTAEKAEITVVFLVSTLGIFIVAAFCVAEDVISKKRRRAEN